MVNVRNKTVHLCNLSESVVGVAECDVGEAEMYSKRGMLSLFTPVSLGWLCAEETAVKTEEKEEDSKASQQRMHLVASSGRVGAFPRLPCSAFRQAS